VPCELDKTKFECDQEMLDKLDELNTTPVEGKEINNPMWEQLNKIKKFNQN